MDDRRRGVKELSLGGVGSLFGVRLCRGGKRVDWFGGRIGRNENVSSLQTIQ